MNSWKAHLKALTLLSISLLSSLPLAKAADFPLYIDFIAFNPPNLHLQSNRVPNAFYIPGLNSGVTYNFTLRPTLTSTLSLASGPVPIALAVYRVPFNCSGNKSVTVRLDYNIGGTFVNIGSQTQTLTVPTTGPIVPTFTFNGIISTDSHILGPGDFVRLQVTANTTRLCLVNEFPLGGTDTDASRVILQTGPIISTTKSVEVIDNPGLSGANPKAIPGAIMRYTITLSNDADASAAGNNITISDPIPSNTTYTFGDNNIILDGTAQTDADDTADNTDFGVTTPNTVTSNLGTVNPGESHTLTFDVTVD
ncbi:MAG: hypothetical protein AAGB35_04040 [Pseudomonadota bacterium]